MGIGEYILVSDSSVEVLPSGTTACTDGGVDDRTDRIIVGRMGAISGGLAWPAVAPRVVPGTQRRWPTVLFFGSRALSRRQVSESAAWRST